MGTKNKELHEFSKRLKEARIGLYTQKQLAEKSGVNIKTIKRLENFNKNDNPSPLAQNLLNVAQVLDVTPEYLLFGNESMEQYMSQIEQELKSLTISEIRFYHKQKLTDKILAHLKLTDSFVDGIWQYWKDNTLSCYRPYVQDTIIRYCHHRPKAASTASIPSRPNNSNKDNQ